MAISSATSLLPGGLADLFSSLDTDYPATFMSIPCSCRSRDQLSLWGFDTLIGSMTSGMPAIWSHFLASFPLPEHHPHSASDNAGVSPSARSKLMIPIVGSGAVGVFTSQSFLRDILSICLVVSWQPTTRNSLRSTTDRAILLQNYRSQFYCMSRQLNMFLIIRSAYACDRIISDRRCKSPGCAAVLFGFDGS